MSAQNTTAPPPATSDLERYDEAKQLVIDNDKASISWLQRQMGVGYNTAARHIQLMELEGIISTPDHIGRRTVLQASTDVQKLAGELYAKGARVTVGFEGDAQISIPIDLPKENRAADDRLRLLIERIERLEEEKKGLGDDIKDAYSELKSVGYDAKVTRQIVRLRKMKPDDRREMEAVLDTYKCALGLD